MTWARHPVHVEIVVDRDMFMFVDSVAKRFNFSRSKVVRMMGVRNYLQIEQPVSITKTPYDDRFVLATYLSEDELDLFDNRIEKYNFKRKKSASRMNRANLIRACIKFDQDRYAKSLSRGGNKNEVH